MFRNLIKKLFPAPSEINSKNSCATYFPESYEERVERMIERSKQIATPQSLQRCQAIEEEMRSFRLLQFQICGCSPFIETDERFWASVNMSNKIILEGFFNELNSYLWDAWKLPCAISKLIHKNAHIDISRVCYDYRSKPQLGERPRSFFEYRPITKNGNKSRTPLILHFTTIAEYKEHHHNDATGEISFGTDGEISSARINIFQNDKCCSFFFGTFNRTFGVKRITMPGVDGKAVLLFDYRWMIED